MYLEAGDEQEQRAAIIKTHRNISKPFHFMMNLVNEEKPKQV
jgi:hypothetical protein